MKLDFIIAAVALFVATGWTAAVPDITDVTSHPAQNQQRDPGFFADLWKRRGGGSSGGKGGSSSSSGGSSSEGGSTSSSGSSSGSSSSSSSGKSGSSSSSSSSSSSGRGSSTSSTGGKTTTGSGVAASYGGGRYYGGGSTVPYRSGTRSTGGISPLPFVFVGASLAFWPGLWLHPVYLYPYTYPWTYHNATTNTNETKPVQCGCAETVECGCDDNNSTEYISSILGNGSYDQLNKTLVTVANVNGTDTILLNGTLPNGTTASGGTDSPSGAVSIKHLAEMAGWWPMLATTLALVLL